MPENKIRYVSIETPIGTMTVGGLPDILFKVMFPNDLRVSVEIGQRLAENERYPIVRKAVVFLERYFLGEHALWSADLIPDEQNFYHRVWRETARIPFGHTVSYGELARRTGRPAAARAVGAAMAKNPIPILVPCHRVVRSDGGLGGFGGGLDVKRWLLEHERQT